mgnify:CR=1 FL=1
MSTLERECSEAVGRLRAALIGLYDSVGADPSSPQEVARTFRINKTLTWNMAKLMQSGDGLAAVPHVPGNSSIERFLKATESKGANKKAVEAVRTATREFERVISVHVGDRATLDLVIDAMPNSDAQGLELSRKRAFLGNSGIYGVQARANLMCCFLAPNEEDPSHLDMVMLRGLLGVRRLRPTVRIPIFRTRQWSSAGQAIASQQWQPIEEHANDAFLSRFNKGEIPEIEAVEAPGGTDYLIQPGPIGNTGAFDCFYGDMIRAGASRYSDSTDETGEFGVTVTAPAECVLFDIVAHKDLDFVLDADSYVYAHLYTGGQIDGQWDEASLLPIRQRATAIPGSPPAVATTLVPHYSDMHGYIYERLGWDPSAFRAIRLEMKYPPLGSTIIQRFGLPARP